MQNDNVKCKNYRRFVAIPKFCILIFTLYI